MSSVFLYMGIIAIWAFVLVPRWLHRHHAQSEAAFEPEAGSDLDTEFADPPEAEFDAGPQAGDDGYGEDPGDEPAYEQYGQPLARPRRQPAREPSAGPAPPRARMLQARRRLLTLLLLLTGIAAGCAYVKVAQWWVCVPPAGLLIMYTMLLRVAAVADAEHAAAASRRATAPRYAQPVPYPQALPDQEPAAEAGDETQQSAQIIDISARLGDQLYDQYEDAAIQAVGD